MRVQNAKLAEEEEVGVDRHQVRCHVSCYLFWIFKIRLNEWRNPHEKFKQIVV